MNFSFTKVRLKLICTKKFSVQTSDIYLHVTVFFGTNVNITFSKDVNEMLKKY